jgi:hypothetical protein
MFLISINNIIYILASFDIWNCYDPLYNMDDYNGLWRSIYPFLKWNIPDRIPQ